MLILSYLVFFISLGMVLEIHGAENQACVAQCQSNYTYPAQPSIPCCGCCGQPSSCHRIPVFATCCSAQQSFCGCLSSRAFCSGNVFNSTYPSESAFGTCYPKGYGNCFYEPTPNIWVVCPIGFTGCIGGGRSTGSCCNSAQTCNRLNGECQAAGPATCNGAAYDASAYDCTTNDQGQQVLCSKGFSSCGAACFSTSQYCCQNGGLKQVAQCSPATSQQTSQQTSQPPITTSGPATCNGAAYDASAYDCTSNGQGQQVLCPKGYRSCGAACYSTTQYCCQAGGLRQVGQCSPATSSQQTSQPPVTTSGPAVCNGAAYDTSAYVCTTNDQGQKVLCPKGTASCGAACYSTSQYCCQNGALNSGQCSTTTSPQAECLGVPYDPSVSDCTTNSQGQSVLCAKGQKSCDQTCYNAAQQCCDKGKLNPLNPASDYCCSSVSDGTAKICPNGQHCCGNILNGTSYFGPENLYTACYNPTQFKCCYGGTSSYLNPATIEPISYTIPQGAVRICQI